MEEYVYLPQKYFKIRESLKFDFIIIIIIIIIIYRDN